MQREEKEEDETYYQQNDSLKSDIYLTNKWLPTQHLYYIKVENIKRWDMLGFLDITILNTFNNFCFVNFSL